MSRPNRSGLRICNKGGRREVCEALKRYACWLRANHNFSQRFPVYLYPAEVLVTKDDSSAVSTFFAPDDRRIEPYARIATGDYPSLKRERGRDSALASYIISLGHQVAHYHHWQLTGNLLTEAAARRRAVAMLRKYEKSTNRP